jgi:hypothetical protein
MPGWITNEEAKQLFSSTGDDYALVLAESVDIGRNVQRPRASATDPRHAYAI